MALTQYTADTDIIETLGTNPEDRPTLTDNTFKGKFDENAANIKAFLNAMIAELLSTANGKGASQIGIEDSASKITATTVEAALAEFATLISTKTSQDGWIPVSDTWAYASALTITVPSGAASKYKKGDKIKLTQTTVKYFNIVGVADALLTITGGSSYALTSATISDVSYSHIENPIGFPEYFSLTAPTYTASGTAFTVQPTSTTIKFKIVENVCHYTIDGLSAASGTGTGIWTMTFTTGQLPNMPNSGGGIAANFSGGTYGFSLITSGTNNVIKATKYDNSALASNSQYYGAFGSYVF